MGKIVKNTLSNSDVLKLMQTIAKTDLLKEENSSAFFTKHSSDKNICVKNAIWINYGSKIFVSPNNIIMDFIIESTDNIKDILVTDTYSNFEKTDKMLRICNADKLEYINHNPDSSNLRTNILETPEMHEALLRLETKTDGFKNSFSGYEIISFDTSLLAIRAQNEYLHKSSFGKTNTYVIKHIIAYYQKSDEEFSNLEGVNNIVKSIRKEHNLDN